jgi:hypothetical protein
MHIALGYYHFSYALGTYFDQAFRDLGHTITYVGLPHPERPGYNSEVPLPEIIAHLSPRPDVYVWIDPAARYFPVAIEDLPIPTVCYLVDVHLGHWRPQAARFFDSVFVAQKDYVADYRQVLGHAQVQWLPLAAAPYVHHLRQGPRIYQVGFVGNIMRAHQHTPRARRLKLIAARFQTNDLTRRYTPEEVGQIYSQSQVVFNVSLNRDVNMRVFEATACGALLLTDANAVGLADLFDIGQEVVVYNDDTDLIEKLTHYLTHENEREAIAQAGCRRTQHEHTYQLRAEQLLASVTHSDFKMIAPMRLANKHERLQARLAVYTHLHMLDAVFDATRAAGYSPLHRAWAACPSLIRRIMI